MSFIDNLPPKKQKLVNNLISVVLIFAILYGALTFAMEVSKTGNFFAYLSSGNFIAVVLMVLFIIVFNKILHGARIELPQQYQKQSQRPPNRQQGQYQQQPQYPQQVPKQLQIGFCNFCGQEKPVQNIKGTAWCTCQDCLQKN